MEEFGGSDKSFPISARTKLDPTRPCLRLALQGSHVACHTAACPNSIAHVFDRHWPTQLPHGTKTRARNSGSLLRRTAAMVPAHIQSSSPHLKMHCGCMRHVNRRTFPRSLPQHAGLYRTCSRASAPFGPLPQHWRLPRSAAHHSPRLATQTSRFDSTGCSLPQRSSTEAILALESSEQRKNSS